MDSFLLQDLQRLKYWCPLPKPIIIHRAIKYHSYGGFDWDVDKLIITIRIDKDIREERETLIHEWAHALTYNENRPTQEIITDLDYILYNGPVPWVKHGDEWGLAYARCYRAVQVPVTSKFSPDSPEINWKL